MMTRRQALKTTTLAAAAAAAPAALAQLRNSTPPTGPGEGLVMHQPLIANDPAAGPFKLPPLPYAYDALEPHLDARTMEIHHDKHHAAYVANLNKAIAEMPGFGGNLAVDSLLQNLNQLPETIRTAVRNNAGGHYNHSLFWQMMKQGGGGEPKGELAKAMDEKFGSFAGFKDAFTKAALGQFGSGWVWLTLKGKELKIEATPNQDSPISPSLVPTGLSDHEGRLLTQIHHSAQPLLGLDVWEHAYYLKYQNKRADYLTAWWNVVDWDFVAGRFAEFTRQA